jgi:hypothetical protein
MYQFGFFMQAGMYTTQNNTYLCQAYFGINQLFVPFVVPHFAWVGRLPRTIIHGSMIHAIHIPRVTRPYIGGMYIIHAPRLIRRNIASAS